MTSVSTHRWQCSMAVCVFVLERKLKIDKAKYLFLKFDTAACIRQLRGMYETRDDPTTS